MRRIWLFFLPLLFLPNLGYSIETTFGTLELTDLLIGPFLLLVLIGGRRCGSALYIQPIPFLILFLIWAGISTATIDLRFDYLFGSAQQFSLLKLAKFSLYGTAGALIIKALRHEEAARYFHWSLLAAGVITALSLYTTLVLDFEALPEEEALAGYKATNAIGVMMAVILCYLAGVYFSRAASNQWMRVALLALPLMLLGLLVSEGRGGWVAALVGGAFLLYRLGPRRQILIAGGMTMFLIIVAYVQLPTVKEQVDKTIFPDMEYLERYETGIAGIDTGARLGIWLAEGPKLLENPLFGTGFFHRGARSGLAVSGSHSFWLQMFLETGIPGGILILTAFVLMWRKAGRVGKDDPAVGYSVQTALLTAFVGAMGGEYFYGGIVSLALLAVYAPAGARRATRERVEDTASYESVEILRSEPLP